MDSPIIMDTAPDFGKPLDRASLVGFPFDDDGFGRRSDIRAHLDDLASRHPEFADHLLGPPWGDIPFHGTFRNRRRGSGTGSSHPDEDARSQASGSSAASAASGASGVSSHGEPDCTLRQDSQPNNQQQEGTRRNPITQYGLRNTVDIGQHQHNMENPDKMSRGQRSMSAPPENRQPQYQQQYNAYQQQSEPFQQQQPQYQQQSEPFQQQPQGSNQRFVSRVDITPQQQQEGTKPPMSPKSHQPPQSPQQQQQQQQPQPQQQQQQKSQQSSTNVRHIPIFVEGRDEPVISKGVKETTFQRQPSPPQFQVPPQFQPPPQYHKPSHFNHQYGSKHWPPHFQDKFFQQPAASSHFEQSPRKRQPQAQQQQYRQNQQQAETPRAQKQQQQQQQPETSEPVRQKPVLPKDPLERVALVQKEVDSLAEQVNRFTGNSRQDKEYIYLDEMLTRELIKLDDIETEGKENVRQARKDTIKSIQNCIALLESKTTVSGQQQRQNENIQETKEQQEETKHEPMETQQESKENEQMNNKAIPLPPGPSVIENTVPEAEDLAEQLQQQSVEQPIANQTAHESAATDSALSKEANTTMEMNEQQQQQETETPEKSKVDDPKKSNLKEKKEKKKLQENKEQQQKSEEKEQQPMDTQKTQGEKSTKAPKSPKSPKKIKKTKKQTPVSEEAIPLPPPETAAK